MANYTKHIFFSLLVIVAIAFGLNYFLNFIPFGMIDWLILLPIIIFYSILPDVDHPNSKARWLMFTIFFAGFMVILAGIIYMVWMEYPKTTITIAGGFGILQAILALVLMSVKHRGAIHTAFAGAIFALPLLYFFKYNWLYFLVAWLSYVAHLLLDGDLGR